ncbi:MAG: SRPBCC family protein [Hyphomonadaceae bacterium]|nr:SRPBCC family protein [Hyphomonadaceae bacterium]
MNQSKFVYVTYIRTTPEKLWAALIEPEFTRQYWAGTHQESDWKVGADWKLMIPDGRIGDSGKVLEFDPPRRLVVTWRNEFMPELKAEGHSTCTYELEPAGSAVKLTVTHEMSMAHSKMINAVSQGWPHLLASLKSLLETGESLVESRTWPEGH